MGQWGPHVHFSFTGLLSCGLGKIIAWGMAATLDGTSAFSILTVGVHIEGTGQSTLASNRFVEAGMVLGHGVSSLTWKVGALALVLGCCLCWGGMQLGAEGFSSTWGLGPSCGVGNSFKFALCQIIYSHWNGYGCWFHHGHLGGCCRRGLLWR